MPSHLRCVSLGFGPGDIHSLITHLPSYLRMLDKTRSSWFMSIDPLSLDVSEMLETLKSHSLLDAMFLTCADTYSTDQLEAYAQAAAEELGCRDLPPLVGFCASLLPLGGFFQQKGINVVLISSPDELARALIEHKKQPVVH